MAIFIVLIAQSFQSEAISPVMALARIGLTVETHISDWYITEQLK